MNNLVIAEQLHSLAKLMELHQENIFKVKAIANAASIIEKLHQDITLQNYQELKHIKGIGQNILEKIKEILIYGKIKELEKYEKITPLSVIELLHIKGLGTARVHTLWKNLHITSIEELILACENNQLAHLKGFGEKTQLNILENARFYLQNKNKVPLGIAIAIAEQIEHLLKQHHIKAERTGELRRHCEIITQLEWITTHSIPSELYTKLQSISHIPITIHTVQADEYYYELFKTTGSTDYLKEIYFSKLPRKKFHSEKEIFNTLNITEIPAFQRESSKEHQHTTQLYFDNKNLISYQDIKGIIHCHTEYSDGLNSIIELANYVKQQGFQYLAICDHSQTAKYANGLSPQKLIQQFNEINTYNAQHTSFKVLKGIECDILKNGTLDYEDDILKQMDIVVVSIHQHFEMDETEATKRIIKAIENPYTNILGHLTGRLITIRKGYPVHHQKIIDACAANHVAIELNANTYRLDIDWRWIHYCMEKNVKIAINPDAHDKTAIHDIRYGIMVAQKAGLTKDMCLNTLNINQLMLALKKT